MEEVNNICNELNAMGDLFVKMNEEREQFYQEIDELLAQCKR